MNMTMAEILRCTESDYETLAGIWERAVLATHWFLKTEDFYDIKAILSSYYFSNVSLYALYSNGAYAGFIGLSQDTIEMLFMDNGCRGQGFGSALLEFAIRQGATKVDVNEQNSEALKFYEDRGFHITSRDETDESGSPYPILHLSL